MEWMLGPSLGIAKQWCFLTLQVEWCVARADCAPAMGLATPSWPSVSAHLLFSERFANGSIAQAFKVDRNALVMGCVRWVSASVLQVGAWLRVRFWQHQSRKHVWIPFVQLGVERMESVSTALAFVSKVGKASIAKIRNARTIVLATVSACSNRRIAQVNVCAAMVGVALVVNELPCTRSSRNVQTIAREMVSA